MTFSNKDNTINRIFYFDAIRALAIIFVILSHVAGPFLESNLHAHSNIAIISMSMGRFGVPLFFMISGALLLGREYPSINSFLKKRFLRIIYPFIFWMIIIAIRLIFYDKNINLLIKMLIGESFTWFIYALIGLYLFIPVLNAFIKEYSIKGVEYFLLIWAITLIINMMNIGLPIADVYHLSLNHFYGFIGFFVLGYYISNKKFKLKKRTMLIIGLIITTISLAVTIYITAITSKPLNYISIPVILQCIGLYLAIRYSSIINKISYNQIIGKITYSISRYSYGMYFSDVVVRGFLFFGLNLVNHSPKLIPIILVVVVVLSWLPNYILGKIPVLAKFSGG